MPTYWRSRCHVQTNISREEWEPILKELGWWPPVDQDDSLAQEARQGIIDSLPAENNTKKLVSATVWYTIYNSVSDIWGILSKSGEGT